MWHKATRMLPGVPRRQTESPYSNGQPAILRRLQRQIRPRVVDALVVAAVFECQSLLVGHA